MKKSRFTETQIVAILNEADAGVLVKDICRKHGISDATYYNWKSKYGGMSASDLMRMKVMEIENSNIKRMGSDMDFENRALKDLIEKSKNSGLNIRSITDLMKEAEEICGKPQKADTDDKIVAAINWVDGTILDVVRKVK